MYISNLYKDIGVIDISNIDVNYINDSIIIIKLPKTEQTGLCNMIGIILTDNINLFISFTNHATVWYPNGLRMSYAFDKDDIDSFSIFLTKLLEEHNKRPQV